MHTLQTLSQNMIPGTHCDRC